MEKISDETLSVLEKAVTLDNYYEGLKKLDLSTELAEFFAQVFSRYDWEFSLLNKTLNEVTKRVSELTDSIERLVEHF